MANLNFKWGLHTNLPQAIAESDIGALFFTKDEGSLYLGVESGKAPKRIQGVVQYYPDTNAFAEGVEPPYSSDVIYYIADQGALIRWDGEKFVIINVTAKEFTEKTAELAADILGNTNAIGGLNTTVADHESRIGAAVEGDKKTAAFDWLRALQVSVDALNALTGLGGGEGTTSLAEQIDALAGRVKPLEDWKNTAASDLTKHGNRLNALEGWKDTTVDPALTDLDKRLDDAESRLNAIDGENGTIAAANGRIDGLATRMSDVEKKATANASDITALKAADTTKGAAISDLQTGLADVKDRVTPLETASTQHGTKIQTLENADIEIEKSIKAISDQLPDIKTDIKAAQNAADTANGAIGDATTQGTVKYDIAQLQAKDTFIAGDIEDLDNRVKANTKEIGNDETADSIKGRLKATEDVADQAAREIVAIKNTLSGKANQSDVNTLNTKVGNLETAVGAPAADGKAATGLYGETAANAAAIDVINQSIGTKGVASNSTVYGAIKAVEGNVTALDNKVNGVSSVADAAKESAKAANDAIGTATTKDTIKYDIAELKKVNATQATTNADFESRLTAAATTIGNHGNEISGLKNSVNGLTENSATKAALNAEIEAREAADAAVRKDLKDIIDSEINAANSLTYVGGIANAGQWDAVKVADTKIGATYVVTSAMELSLDLDNNANTAAVKCYAGDLLIATAAKPEDEVEGVLPANKAIWVHVESGYKAELQGKLSVVDGTASAKINLTSLNGNGTAGDLGAVTLTSSNPNLTVEASGSTVTFNMVWGSF